MSQSQDISIFEKASVNELSTFTQKSKYSLMKAWLDSSTSKNTYPPILKKWKEISGKKIVMKK